MDPIELEKLIDETNADLLAGAPCSINEMSKEELSNFLTRIEKLYKACLKIRFSQSVKIFKAGLDFSNYKAQAEERDKKKESKKEKIIGQTKLPKLGGIDMGSLMNNIMEMKAKMVCDVHNKLKTECGCK